MFYEDCISSHVQTSCDSEAETRCSVQEKSSYEALEDRVNAILETFSQGKEPSQSLIPALLDLLEELQDFQNPFLNDTVTVADAIRLDTVIVDLIEKLSQEHPGASLLFESHKPEQDSLRDP